MARVVYFSNVTGNTHRFVQKLERPAIRIPLRPTEPPVFADEPYVLFTPTYGGGADTKAVPKQVIRFLNHEPNRRLLRGVIGGGNLNFGQTYCLAAHQIAERCEVPVLAEFEISGTSTDLNRIIEILENHPC